MLCSETAFRMALSSFFRSLLSCRAPMNYSKGNSSSLSLIRIIIAPS
jgi:hypothetical protein